MPKQVHLQFIEKNIEVTFKHYEILLSSNINQTQALQFLFDIKFLTLFAVARENITHIQKSQEICDKLRSKVDPFDLDVFYSYLQYNVKQSVLQSQVIHSIQLYTYIENISYIISTIDVSRSVH